MPRSDQSADRRVRQREYRREHPQSWEQPVPFKPLRERRGEVGEEPRKRDERHAQGPDCPGSQPGSAESARPIGSSTSNLSLCLFRHNTILQDARLLSVTTTKEEPTSEHTPTKYSGE